MRKTVLVAVAIGVLIFNGCRSKGTGEARWLSETSENDGIAKTQLCVGAQHACGIRPDGSVTCWRSNLPVTRNCERYFDREFPYVRDNSVPECGQSEPPPGPFVELACGMVHTCGIRPNGRVECWGSNNSGQLEVPSHESFEHIRSHIADTCGVTREGNVHCWGLHKFFSSERWVVADIAPTGIDYAAWRGVENFTGVCGLKRKDRERVCVSWNHELQKSGGPGWLDAVEGLALHADPFRCGIRLDGSLKCVAKFWSPPPGRFRQIVRHGRSRTPCALSETGSVACFARNIVDFPTAPALFLDHDMLWSFPLPGNGYAEVAAGDFALCGRTREGSVKCVYAFPQDRVANPTPEFASAT